MAADPELKLWKARWELVNQTVEEERRNSSDDWRLAQLLKLNVAGRDLGLHTDTVEGVQRVRDRWMRLREVLGA